MLLAEMDIMGDPYFLCTGGIGNQLKTADTTAINDNQVQLLYGDLIIDVEFRNPQDIGKDGFISFNKIQTSPFHGAYRVIKITHQFKEGVFKQHLELNKISGQDPNNTLQFIDRASNTGEKTSNGGSVTADASDKNDRSLKNSPSNNNTKNPPAQPIAVAPTVPVSVDEQQIIDKAGAAALAKAKGVNITELSSDYKSLISKPANTILGKALASIGINIG